MSTNDTNARTTLPPEKCLSCGKLRYQRGFGVSAQPPETHCWNDEHACARMEREKRDAAELASLRSQLRDLTEELEREKGQLAEALRRAAEAEAALADVRTLDEKCTLVDLQLWAGPTWSLEIGHPDWRAGNKRFLEGTPEAARAKAAAWVRGQATAGTAAPQR